MGGRYQTIHVDLRGCSLSVEAVVLSDDAEPFAFTVSVPVPSTSCVSFFSPELFEEPRSNVPPEGVFGVLAEDPNDANAPDPRPNADEAFIDGDDAPAERGDIALKGLDRPWELSGPKRFAV